MLGMKELIMQWRQPCHIQVFYGTRPSCISSRQCPDCCCHLHACKCATEKSVDTVQCWILPCSTLPTEMQNRKDRWSVIHMHTLPLMTLCWLYDLMSASDAWAEDQQDEATSPLQPRVPDNTGATLALQKDPLPMTTPPNEQSDHGHVDDRENVRPPS